MGLLHDGVQFLLREGGDELAVRPALNAIQSHLDAVDPILDLYANLLDRLVTAGDEAANRGVRHADPGGVPVRESLARGEIAAGCRDPRAFEEPEVDRIAHSQAQLACVARRADRRVPGGDDFLREEQAADGAELQGLVQIDIFLGLRVAVSQMGVNVLQSWHHEIAAVIQDVVRRGDLRRLRGWADVCQHPIRIEHQCLVRQCLVPIAREEGPTAHMFRHDCSSVSRRRMRTPGCREDCAATGP